MILRIISISKNMVHVSVETCNPDGIMGGRKEDYREYHALGPSDVIEVMAGGYVKVCKATGDELKKLNNNPLKSLSAQKGRFEKYLSNMEFQLQAFLKEIREMKSKMNNAPEP